MENNFYVYVYLNPLKSGKFIYLDNGIGIDFEYEPFYIGKGKENRLKHHLKEVEKLQEQEDFKESSNKHKINTIHKILRNGKDPIIYKIVSGINNKNANLLEKVFIRLIGRSDKKLGPLTNLTDGGEGNCGGIASKETREKIRKFHIGLHIIPNLTPEQRKKKSDAVKGENNPACAFNARRKISDSNKNKVKDIKPETRLKYATAKGKVWVTKDNIELYIKEEELDCYLSMGWIRGRSKIIKDKIMMSHLTNGIENWSKTTIWVHKKENNEIVRERIPKEKCEEYIKTGWEYGVVDHDLPDELIDMFYNTTTSISNIGKLFGFTKCYLRITLKKILGRKEYDKVVLDRINKRKSKVV